MDFQPGTPRDTLATMVHIGVTASSRAVGLVVTSFCGLAGHTYNSEVFTSARVFIKATYAQGMLDFRRMCEQGSCKNSPVADQYIYILQHQWNIE